MKHNHASNWGNKKQTPTYNSWRSMIQRCTNPKHKWYFKYKNFYYPPWSDFITFIKDMGERPPNTSLDRIDNSKGYSPDNCRWASRATQMRNRDMCVLSIEEANKIRAAKFCGWTISQLARQFYVSESVIKGVLYRNAWSE